jgi:ABC-type proline/glycine betaine transport system permease subunit
MNTITGLDLQGALDQLHMVEHVQITYGAIILSFLGAIHWGMEFSKQGGEHGYRRLALGVVPVLFAVPTTFLPHGLALVSQWFGFTGLWLVDQKTSQRGWSESHI